GWSRHFESETGKRFFRFFLPICATEALGRDDVPATGFLIVSRLFLDRSKFPRHHRVTRSLKKFGKLEGCVRTVFCLADAGLNLSPISHVGDIVAPKGDASNKGSSRRLGGAACRGMMGR